MDGCGSRGCCGCIYVCLRRCRGYLVVSSEYHHLTAHACLSTNAWNLARVLGMLAWFSRIDEWRLKVGQTVRLMESLSSLVSDGILTNNAAQQHTITM